MEQFEVADDASSGTGRDVDTKRKAVVTYERVQLVIRVPMLLFGYGVLALWLYVAIRWNQEDGARQNLPEAEPLGEVNMWFGIPIVCSVFAIIFDTWDIVALSSPTRTRARPGILLTHELLNIITMTCGVIFGYRSSYNEEYFDLAKSDNERYPFAALYLAVASVSLAFLASRAFMFCVTLVDACYWEQGPRYTRRRRIPDLNKR